ncbi:restriction endonuclease subunit S [Aeromonas hydrophila]|nr:restriction endonuclease subunit S [Aeromonas hydrophila]QNF19180.1 restriction endonuclease subunit S [Aeromonas jandaei]
MGRYRPYPEYKDSGVIWSGFIPSHWEPIRFKHVFVEKPKTSNIELPAGSISFGQVVFKDEEKLAEETKASYQEVKVGEFLVNPLNLNFDLKSLRTALSEIDVVVSTGYIVLQCYRQLEARYARWLLHEFDVAHMKSLGAGVRQTIGFNDIGNSYFCMPRLEEQLTIAAFLDHETARIDRLIAKQQQLIELLKEKRQAVISHAVTKGLNPNTPMKDSGVEWLGQVPEHWGVSPLKYKCEFSGGGTPSKDNLEYWNGSIPWVSPKDMKSFWITDAEDKITEQAIKESSTKLVQPGAVLMVVRSGILQRTIPVGINTIPVTMNQDMKAIRFSSAVYAEWLSFFIKGYEDSLLLDWRKQGATVESIEHEYLANSLILFPPEEEARSIIAALGRRLDKFDQLEQRASDAITLLQERRTALISAAVTGKIDLRGWTPPAEEVAA